MTEHTLLELVFGDDEHVAFLQGQTIFHENTEGNCMYLIRSGEVELSFGGKTLAQLSVGDTLGELALVDDENRAATAVALSDCELIPINKERFLELIQQSPYFALDVMRVLAQRLRQMNKLLHGG